MALADGYIEFYKCTEQPGVGTMGQHFVNLDLVGDPAIDPLRPEVLVYAPKRNGRYKLVAVEYVTFAGRPRPCSARSMNPVGAGNRYGLTASSPSTPGSGTATRRACSTTGTRSITCLGEGDNGG